MQRKPVTSSTIAEIGYEPARSVLEILFKNGGVYQYFDVPQREYDSLMKATSQGQYLNANIKGRFRYARV
jgi:hypothetical protein